MENIKNLKEIASQILFHNSNSALSGSLALHLQGFKTRRKPSDIDITVPYNKPFTPITGMEHFDCSDDYDESDYTRGSYKFGDIKIDVFYPIKNKVLETDIVWIDKPINAVKWSEILKFKLEHSFDENYEDEKHRDDLIWFLQNNKVF